MAGLSLGLVPSCPSPRWKSLNWKLLKQDQVMTENERAAESGRSKFKLKPILALSNAKEVRDS